MSVLDVGDQLPDLTAVADNGDVISTAGVPGWIHLWFNPVFGKFGCRDCQGSLMHELYPDLRLADCQPIGATFDPPQVNARRNEPHVWRVPIVQIDRDQAAAFAALRDPSDAWAAWTPASVAYLVNPDGVIVRVYRDIDHTQHAKQVLSDLAALAPQEADA